MSIWMDIQTGLITYNDLMSFLPSMYGYGNAYWLAWVVA